MTWGIQDGRGTPPRAPTTRVTGATFVSMLWAGAMKRLKLRSLAPLFAALVVASPLAGCDNDMPPPATPQNASTDVPPPDPAQGSATAAAQGDDGSMYASGEYVVGDNADAYDDNDPSALTDFHGTLDKVGAWRDDATYGTVWQPSADVVGTDFVPYKSAGHWVLDENDDYVWVSDYDWGWAPFHYGRWVWIPGSGWAWVPGRVYRGAWVEWGWDYDYGYVGWYPMAPGFFWFGGVAVAYGFYVGPSWVYCARGEVFSPVVGTRVIAGPAVAGVAARVRVAATPGLGPAPARLGLAGSSVPHLSGTAAASVQHAQAFSHPSSAVSMGGSPRIPSTPAGSGSSFGRPGYSGAQGSMAQGVKPNPSLSGKHVTPDATAVPRRSGGVPTYRGGSGVPTYHGGSSGSFGGGSRGGGGSFGGGGHGGGGGGGHGGGHR